MRSSKYPDNNFISDVLRERRSLFFFLMIKVQPRFQLKCKHAGAHRFFSPFCNWFSEWFAQTVFLSRRRWVCISKIHHQIFCHHWSWSFNGVFAAVYVYCIVSRRHWQQQHPCEWISSTLRKGTDNNCCWYYGNNMCNVHVIRHMHRTALAYLAINIAN